MPLAAPSLALAQTKEFRLGILTPAGHPWNRAALKVGEDLKAATNGRLTLTVFHSGPLGNEAAMLQQMRSGALDMGWIMAAELGSRVPTIVVSDFARRGYVDPQHYDTTSILKLITRRFGLEPLPGVRSEPGDLSDTLDLLR